MISWFFHSISVGSGACMSCKKPKAMAVTAIYAILVAVTTAGCGFTDSSPLPDINADSQGFVQVEPMPDDASGEEQVSENNPSEETVETIPAEPDESTESVSQEEPAASTKQDVRDAAAYDAETAALVTDEQWGLTLQVPDLFCNDVVRNSTDSIVFEFFDGTTQDLTGMYGEIWNICVYGQEQFDMEYQDGELEADADGWLPYGMNANSSLVGRDENHLYVLHRPSDVQYNPNNEESAASYYLHTLYGYTMLLDFFTRNKIAPSPYWEQEYLLDLRALSLQTGDFFTTEFGLCDTGNTEDALKEQAANIPNLATYDGIEALTWDDFLLYRLIHADYDSLSEDAEELQAQLQKRFIPYSEASFANRDTTSSYENVFVQIHKLFLQLKEDPALPQYCAAKEWYVFLDDGNWCLELKNGAAETTVLLPGENENS